MRFRHLSLLGLMSAALFFASACQRSVTDSAGAPWIEGTGTAWSAVENPRGLARMKLLEAAQEEARASIRQQFETVQVKPGISVMQAMEDDPYTWSRIMGLLKSAKAHDQQIDDEGKATVRLRLSQAQVRDIALYAEEAEAPAMP